MVNPLSKEKTQTPVPPVILFTVITPLLLPQVDAVVLTKKFKGCGCATIAFPVTLQPFASVIITE